jgi:SOS-response transcriptional repressor LexA
MFFYKPKGYSIYMKNNEIITRLRLAMKQSGVNQAKLAKSVGITPQAVGRWFKNNVIGKDSLILAAKATSVSVGWLLTGEGENPISDNNTIRTIQPSAMIPLISWVQAGSWSEVVDNFEPGDAEEYYPCPERHSSNTFALTVVGESMSPDFIPGEIIYVDPCVEAISGSCVVVRQNGDTEATFKQLMLDGSKKYLKALNPNWPSPILEMLSDAVICGVVIGSYRKRN